MSYHMVEFIGEALNLRTKSLNGSKILELGVSYKRDIDDLRESPAIMIIEALQKSGLQLPTTIHVFQRSERNVDSISRCATRGQHA